ncbi:MAG: protein kinase, partial [Rickettsiales bacterium]|nr:protein kinase [Rickettsiales bacterium]
MYEKLSLAKTSKYIYDRMADLGYAVDNISLREVGRGSHGYIYRMYDTTGPDKKWALKWIHILYQDRSPNDNSEMLYWKRCCQEPNQVASANLLKIHHVDEEIILMDYHEGMDLLKLHDKYPARARKAIENSCTGLLGGLEEMNGRGVVHGDIKLNNLVFDEEKELLVIVDFGTASECALDNTLESGAGILAMYCSPETILSKDCFRRKSDLWSLGVVMFEAITARKMFMVLDFAKSELGPLDENLYSLSYFFYTSAKALELAHSNPERWYNFIDQEIDKVGDDLENSDFWKVFLRGILDPDFKTRLTVAEALEISSAEDQRRMGAEKRKPEEIVQTVLERRPKKEGEMVEKEKLGGVAKEEERKRKEEEEKKGREEEEKQREVKKEEEISQRISAVRQRGKLQRALKFVLGGLQNFFGLVKR